MMGRRASPHETSVWEGQVAQVVDRAAVGRKPEKPVDRKMVGRMRQHMRKLRLPFSVIAVGEAVLDFFGIQGLAYPSQETLGRRLRLSARHVRRLLKVLQGRGLLRWVRQRRKPNVYVFDFSAVDATAAPLDARCFNDAPYAFAGGHVVRRPWRDGRGQVPAGPGPSQLALSLEALRLAMHGRGLGSGAKG